MKSSYVQIDRQAKTQTHTYTLRRKNQIQYECIKEVDVDPDTNKLIG